MTDANGSRNNSNSRRQRRSARLTADNDATRIGVAPRKGTEGKTAPTQQPSSVVGRRSRRRRPVGRQIAVATGPSDQLLNPTGSSRVSRIEGLSNQTTPLSKRQNSGASSRPGALRAVPPSRLLVPGQSSAKGRRNSSDRTASNKAATAGSVPLLSSLGRRRSRRPKLSKYMISAIWILVGGLGLATIFGTILANRPGGEPNAAVTASVLATDSDSSAKFPIALGQEIPKLQAQLDKLTTLYPELQFKAFYIDVDTGDYVDIDGRGAIAAASTIKLPILLAFFEEIDKGNIDPNQTIAILPEQIAEGSGDMQISPPGTQFTAIEVATQMIVNSDNTATNMMIDLLGGAEVLNERFVSYGLEETRLNNPLPDIEGANTTSARDLVHSMLLVQSDRLKMRSRDRVLNILERTENKRLLPAGLEEQGALTYNKTGFIDKMLGDVALVDLSNGKRYVISVLVESPDNDGRALDLIHGISERTFQYTDQAIQPAVTPLGNPESNPESNPEGSPAASSPADSSQPSNSSAPPNGTRDTTTTQPQTERASSPAASEPSTTEDPYPSANPE